MKAAGKREPHRNPVETAKLRYELQLSCTLRQTLAAKDCFTNCQLLSGRHVQNLIL